LDPVSRLGVGRHGTNLADECGDQGRIHVRPTGFGNRIGDSRGVGDPANLHVAPTGEFEAAGAESLGCLGQGLQLTGGDHASRQAHPGQRTVRGLMKM